VTSSIKRLDGLRIFDWSTLFSGARSKREGPEPPFLHIQGFNPLGLSRGFNSRCAMCFVGAQAWQK
jgi:hypothetical protein